MTGVLLQVRLDSTRLPNKALLKLKDLTITEHALRALLNVDAQKYIVVTTEDSIGQLEPLITKWGWDYHIGSKENVLERFVGAIRKFNLDRIIRATGDNPLVSAKMANILIKEHIKLKNNYSGYLNSPLGTGVEVVESSSLIEAYTKTNQKYDMEHVTPYIYNNRDKFKVFQEDAPDDFLMPGTRVTIDTKEDFIRIEKLYNELYYGDIIEIESVVKWLKQKQLLYTPI